MLKICLFISEFIYGDTNAKFIVPLDHFFGSKTMVNTKLIHIIILNIYA
jgi:hypothetical protein